MLRRGEAHIARFHFTHFLFVRGEIPRPAGSRIGGKTLRFAPLRFAGEDSTRPHYLCCAVGRRVPFILFFSIRRVVIASSPAGVTLMEAPVLCTSRSPAVTPRAGERAIRPCPPLPSPSTLCGTAEPLSFWGGRSPSCPRGGRCPPRGHRAGVALLGVPMAWRGSSKPVLPTRVRRAVAPPFPPVRGGVVHRRPLPAPLRGTVLPRGGGGRRPLCTARPSWRGPPRRHTPGWGGVPVVLTFPRRQGGGRGEGRHPRMRAAAEVSRDGEARLLSSDSASRGNTRQRPPSRAAKRGGTWRGPDWPRRSERRETGPPSQLTFSAGRESHPAGLAAHGL